MLKHNNFTINKVSVQDDSYFENYVAKRLISILCGNIPFKEACNQIIKEIIKEKEDSLPTTNQTAIFTNAKKYKKVSLR